MAEQELALINAKDILEMCKSDAAKMKIDLFHRLYRDFKKEIMDTFKIREFISKQMTHSINAMQYIYIGPKPHRYKNVMHREPELKLDGIHITYKDMMAIFTTTIYGEEPLIDVLKREFPDPFEIYSEDGYDYDTDGYYYVVIIVWPRENLLPNDDRTATNPLERKNKECILL